MPNTGSIIGSIVTLWRYPVKSMLGEELNVTEVLEQGLVGDRAYALIDQETGKTISAKAPRKWGKLFDCRAVLHSPSQVKITLPDGTQIFSDAANVDTVLSDVLQRAVKLETAAPAAPEIEMYTPDIDGLPGQDTVTDIGIHSSSFFDGATVHLLTTATLDQLQAIAARSRFEPRRFRPNLVVRPANGATGFVENDWIDKTLAIGDQVRLRITGPCPRCVMTTLPQSELPPDLDVLRTVVKHNEGNVGVYASVLQNGMIRRGDPMSLV